jgi:hypothetical protein
MLIGCFTRPRYVDVGLGGRLRKVFATSYLGLGGGFAAASEANQGLEGCHRFSPAIVVKNKFIKVNLRSWFMPFLATE